MDTHSIFKNNFIRGSLNKPTKILCLACFANLFAANTNVYAQEVDLSSTTLTTQEVMEEIESKTDYLFVYDKSEINLKKKISLNTKSSELDDILQALFTNTDIVYAKEGNNIVLMKKNSVQEQKQVTRKITGTVLDAKGEPVIGANVLVKGTTNGTITDMDGKFMLNVSNGILEVSFIGYQTQQIQIGRKSSFSITLKEDSELLNEVVVVGYGVMKKSDLTGSVGTVKAKDIQKMPVASVDQALQGRVSGMQITSVSGAPGAGTTIRIRGGNSINAGNEPLYVIDGIIGGGDLSSINPSDIASIEVLKDASSTAIYGSRGANGVVLITTKRGDGAKGTKLSYSGYYGIQTAAKKIDFMNGKEAAEFQNEFAEYKGVPHPYQDLNAIHDTNWYDYIFQKSAPMTDHNVSLANSTDNGNYFLSLNYFNQEGLMYKSNFERYQIRFNIDQKIGNHIKLGATLTTSMTNRDNPILNGIDLLPTAPVYNEDGSYFAINEVSGKYYDNPVAQRDGIWDETRMFRGLGNVYAQFTPIKNLIIKSSWGFDVSHSKNNRYESVNLPTRVYDKLGGFASVKTDFPISYQNENTINYSFDIKEHSISLLGGFTWQKFQSEFLHSSAFGFKNDINRHHAMETGDPITRDIQTGEQEWGMMSYLFRVNYGFKNRYLVTVSGRQDGSSRLAEGNKWAFFPSVALAWRASEEKFIKNVDWISNLKVRASYGTSGSQSVAPYATIDRLNSGGAVIGGKEVISYVPGSSANKNLGWEKTKQVDLGIDLGLFNNRLSLELDAYYKRTNDLLLERELPYQTGFSQILENIGSVDNKGLEISVHSTNIDNQDFTWNSGISISLNRNKVRNLGGKEFMENGRGSRIITGEPLGTFFGVKYLGTWKEDEIPEGTKHLPGDPKLEDLNKDGLIDVNDGQIIGNAEPKFYGGFSNDFTYKRFSLNVFFDFSYGNDIYDYKGFDWETGWNINTYGHNRNRWTPSNPKGEYPRAGSASDKIHANYAGGEHTGGNSLYVHDGSYLRLKNISLQYDVPMGKQKVIKSLQVYMTATNLFTITPYFGYTPDVSGEGTSVTRRGFDKSTYPANRTFLFGLKANF